MIMRGNVKGTGLRWLNFVIDVELVFVWSRVIVDFRVVDYLKQSGVC